MCNLPHVDTYSPEKIKYLTWNIQFQYLQVLSDIRYNKF